MMLSPMNRPYSYFKLLSSSEVFCVLCLRHLRVVRRQDAHCFYSLSSFEWVKFVLLVSHRCLCSGKCQVKSSKDFKGELTENGCCGREKPCREGDTLEQARTNTPSLKPTHAHTVPHTVFIHSCVLWLLLSACLCWIYQCNPSVFACSIEK